MQLSLSPTRHNLYIAVKNTVVSINEFSLSQTIAQWLSRMHFQTRMHSSRMRTFCNSSCLLAGGVSSTPPQEQAPPRKKALPPRAGTPSPGAGTPPGDLLQGMLGYHLQGMLGYHPPPREQIHSCKNITFATSLRTVTI